MLTAASLPELIVADEAGYHALAASLARHPESRQAMKSRLVATRRNAPPKHIDLT